MAITNFDPWHYFLRKKSNKTWNWDFSLYGLIFWEDRPSSYLCKKVQADFILDKNELIYFEKRIKADQLVYKWSLLLEDISVITASRRTGKSYISFFDKEGVGHHLNLSLKPKGWESIKGELRNRFKIRGHWWFVVEGEGIVLFPNITKRKKPYDSALDSRQAFRNWLIRRTGFIHPANFVLKEQVIVEAKMYQIGQ